MDQKEKRDRRAHLKDFEKDASGKYVYKGAMYGYQGSSEARRRTTGKLWTLSIAALCAIVLCGCIPAPGMNDCTYILLPYMIELVAACYFCWKLGRLTIAGDPLREYVYEDLTEKIPMGMVITALGSGAGFAGELVYLIQNGTNGKTGTAVLFLILEAAACAACVLGKTLFSKMKWAQQNR
ncbi:MAG: hypothetical protein SOZ59_10130 [Candidatus Limivivens sp.]|nr:hypothetical protein [Candidatus Limivivens sp.]